MEWVSPVASSRRKRPARSAKGDVFRVGRESDAQNRIVGRIVGDARFGFRKTHEVVGGDPAGDNANEEENGGAENDDPMTDEEVGARRGEGKNAVGSNCPRE